MSSYWKVGHIFKSSSLRKSSKVGNGNLKLPAHFLCGDMLPGRVNENNHIWASWITVAMATAINHGSHKPMFCPSKWVTWLCVYLLQRCESVLIKLHQRGDLCLWMWAVVSLGETLRDIPKNGCRGDKYLVLVNGTVYLWLNFVIIIYHLKHSWFWDQSCQSVECGLDLFQNCNSKLGFYFV